MGKSCLTTVIGVFVAGWALFLFYQVLFITYPVWPWLLVFSFALMLVVVLGDQDRASSKAALDTLVPVVIGLVFSMGFILLVNLFSPDARWMWRTEILLMRLALKLKNLSEPPILLFAALLLTLALLDTMLRKVHLISSLLAAKRFVEFAAYVLLTVTAFTFFAQYPIEQQMRSSRRVAHSQGPATEEELKRRKALAENSAALADLMIGEVRADPSISQVLRIFIRSIRERARPLEYEGVIENIVDHARSEQSCSLRLKNCLERWHRQMYRTCQGQTSSRRAHLRRKK